VATPPASRLSKTSGTKNKLTQLAEVRTYEVYSYKVGIYEARNYKACTHKVFNYEVLNYNNYKVPNNGLATRLYRNGPDFYTGGIKVAGLPLR